MRLKRFFASEVGVTIWWIVAVMLLGAAMAPWLHQVGKGFAEIHIARGTGGILGDLAASCDNAKFSRYYSRSLQFFAIILLPFVFWRIRAIRKKSLSVCVCSEVSLTVREKASHVLIGFFIAAVFLWLAGIIAESLGIYSPASKLPSIGRFVNKVIVPAVAVSFLEEWLFRGILLGLWLKLVRPIPAIVGVSLFFAFIHFLDPPAGSVLPDPSSPWAGFVLLGKVLLHFGEPAFFIRDFAALLAIGLILGWARLRTGALWFSIGLHAGWVFAFKGFNLYHKIEPDHPMRPWLVGDSLRSGILPLATVLVTAVICHFFLNLFCKERRLTRASQ